MFEYNVYILYIISPHTCKSCHIIKECHTYKIWFSSDW